MGKKSWGYIKDEKFRTPESLIDELVDIVSKNGCLLLNIGPKSDGTIPDEVQHILLDMGKWLTVNGEAIYATRPWKIYGEGPTKVVGGSFKDTATERLHGSGHPLYGQGRHALRDCAGMARGRQAHHQIARRRFGFDEARDQSSSDSRFQIQSEMDAQRRRLGRRITQREAERLPGRSEDFPRGSSHETRKTTLRGTQAV